MVLHKLTDLDSSHDDVALEKDIKGLSVYVESTDDKVGTVADILVDEEGNFRYLLVDLGFWIFGKKVLLPIGRCRIDYDGDRVYAVGMTRQQAESLPEYDDSLAVDYDYEERVRGVYRQPNAIGGIGTLESRDLSAPVTPVYNRDTYTYNDEPDLYGMDEENHQTLRLYQERLVASKKRQKTGEVSISKHVETETATVSTPVERERVVIERVTPVDAGVAVSPDSTAFREGTVTNVELYEEIPEIRKETFVREEVRVKKVVDQDTVESQETVRREELDVSAPGLPVDRA
ncbi:DUF2382 domain-containing protein [Calothrix sp. PCC 6303]|uniref:DUF2382 domain-containing protein n=1 Tax=Calothrix sp. PCC 6303 TaxID=1170562 RepID=UPI0002A032DD|nr:DUF2382 domain-containing protein [Calothrix sp. PCC 6303]AFZ00651.1 hypothetical protein Cal6303_1608 [Calothrix sp. PCC 6303]